MVKSKSMIFFVSSDLDKSENLMGSKLEQHASSHFDFMRIQAVFCNPANKQTDKQESTWR